MQSSTGALLALGILAVTAVVGFALRRRNGRFVAVSVGPVPPAQPATSPLPASQAQAAAGSFPTGPDTAGDSQDQLASAPDETVVPVPLREALGISGRTPLTLLQFSSAFCAPCRTTRVLCADVARTVPGVAHVEVDAESHLDAVRALDIWRTPTVLIIDDAGRIRRRASGAPTKAQLMAAVAAEMPSPGPSLG